MKEKMKKLFAATLAGVMGFSFAACNTNTGSGTGGNGESGGNGENGGNGASSTYSYLAIDINPSIEFVVNGEIVVGVKACNDDASVLLSGENLENMSVEAATEKVVELAEELGYLTEENNDVKIMVTADTEELTASLELLAERGVGKGSLLAKINYTPRITDERQVNELKKEHGEKFKDLSAGKLRLIEAIMEYDETMTYEIGIEMSVSELSEMLDKYVDEMADIVGDEMEELFERKYKEIRREAYGRIAALYGEEYKAVWDRFVALEKVVKEIEKKAEKLVITPEDVEELQKILGWEDETTTETEETESTETAQTFKVGGHKGVGRPEINEKGEMHLDDFDKFFDCHEDFFENAEKYKEAYDKVEEILENYDEDAYVLTEEDLAAITTAWGEAIEVTTFEDLEDFLDEQEKALEEMREGIELPLLVQMEIQVMEEAMKDVKEQAKEFMKAQMEFAKLEFQARKDELRSKHAPNE
ncbi:MAG: hypothetical protein IKA72_02870 [Clostridia bacterium]|nr:hypothetical protein [Clostridia bacterium]